VKQKDVQLVDSGIANVTAHLTAKLVQFTANHTTTHSIQYIYHTVNPCCTKMC